MYVDLDEDRGQCGWIVWEEALVDRGISVRGARGRKVLARTDNYSPWNPFLQITVSLRNGMTGGGRGAGIHVAVVVNQVKLSDTSL